MPRLRWIIFAAFGLLVVFIAGTVYFYELQKIASLREAIAERTAQLEERERNVQAYREKINFYKTKEGIAHLAREQYNLALPGERVFIVVPNSADPVLEYPAP